MKPLTQLWDQVRLINRDLDIVGERVRRAIQREPAKGRELPYFLAKRFVFENGDLEQQESPLVQDAQRETKIVRLLYNVTLELEGFLGARTVVYPMRVSRTGMWFQAGQSDALTAVFDFDWTFKLGSTERRYTNGRVTESALFNSREALGNPESPDSRLLFSNENPLVLRTNEFLTFAVKPTLYNPELDLTALASSWRFVVEIQGIGYRSFTYDS
jgi:hypothetical protein